MKRFVLGVTAAGALAAQSVGGPVLGYVVDGAARMHAVYGMPAAAHVGAAVREGVREAAGDLALGADGRAWRNGMELEGKWARLEPGALLDASGRQVLVAGGERAPWRLMLPAGARAVRVSPGGERVLTLLEDETMALWNTDGQAEFRVSAGEWWKIAFAGERAVAYDPAEHALLAFDGQGAATVLRKLDGTGGRYELGATRDGGQLVLLGEGNLTIVPAGGGEMRTMAAPEGAERLEPLRGGEAFLLGRDPARPLWILDPGKEQALVVIPALDEKGGQQ